jgi:U3 small nucleolar RNA-associated protein MPP10
LYAFIFKKPLPEAKVVSNMPTIAMEEVAPINVSETNQMAPEEIHVIIIKSLLSKSSSTQ